MRHSPIAAAVLTGAEVDTVAGLLSLREGHAFALYAAPATLAALADNPIFNVLNPVLVARRALDLGFYLGITGIVTFKNADEVREVVQLCPLERLLIETDAPYLAPVPYRGKTNEPAYVPLVAAKIAEVKGLAVEEVALATTANARRLFKLEKQ
jgi:TatD DNase family protein